MSSGTVCIFLKEMNKEEAVKEFLSVFGGEGREIITVFSPGRINLIGEHIDYNGGRVFPAALTIGTYLSAALRDDQKVRFFSGNFKEKGIYEWDLPISGPDKRKGFSNYLAGMIEAYEKVLGLSVHKGFDLYLWGNIPNSSGLSSSASVETGMGKILNELYGFSVSNFEIAKLGQYSENHFNGVNCGIMD